MTTVHLGVCAPGNQSYPINRMIDNLLLGN